MNIQYIRTRWAAVGAAVAITLGAGGIGITHATTSSGEMPVYVPIEPCRLADTRPAFLVGTRATPIGADESFTLSGWGTVGDCTLPSGTTGLSLNVTATDPTQATFLTLFPAASTRPTASHLNPTPGQPPTPNAVNVDLDASGEFKVFNRFGAVHIIIDVVGYFDDHVHTGDDIVDGSLTGADIEDGSVTGADVANNTLSNSKTSNEAGIASGLKTAPTSVAAGVTRVGTTSIRVPSDGYVHVQVNGSYSVGASAGTALAFCQVTKGGVPGSLDLVNLPFTALTDFGGSGAYVSGWSTSDVLEMDVADNPLFFNSGQTIGVDCISPSGSITTDNVIVTATFFPTSYEPAPLIILP